MKIFANAIGVDCESAASLSPTQALAVSPAEVEGGKPLALRFVLFQKVDSLTLFFPCNFNGEEVRRRATVAQLTQPLHMLSIQQLAR